MLGFPHPVRHGPSQTGRFPHRTVLSALRTSLTQCALPLRAISARAWGIWAMVLDGPFPQFRSHGRIDGTGPGNFRARLSSPSARHSCRCKQSLRCMGERESRAVGIPTVRAVPSLRCAQCGRRKHRESECSWRSECGVILGEKRSGPQDSQRRITKQIKQ